ncbi:formate dehydrogenase subunit delta [Bordetella bronchiseptica]|uniref:formate dehydrogenase subunit delta n=1 Tax=Bordetella bronchiseptica TaxID=518 RepID=UPI00046123FA|nr:formate dehydrogenase subunit delta [Bordetella bronchiseptica]KDD12748.1 NADH-dependent formate dehydrogenase delta subunit FdsD [Bordetella bronchiseptica MBORD731]
MEIGNLIRMANRIGDFFDAYPDRAEAQAGIATHIQKFWEPRMRIQLLAFVARHPDGDDGQARLNGIVLHAVRDARARLTPKA